MKRKHLIPALSVALTACVFALPASAHHSTAMFKWGKGETLEGTVTKFDWTQPHTEIDLNVTGKDGKTVQWILEGMSPSHLARHGWGRNTVKAGDKVKILIYPAKDDYQKNFQAQYHGRKFGFAVEVTYPDGKKYDEVPVQIP